MSDEDEKTICYVCEKAEDRPDRIIECVQCSKSAHFRCKNLRGNAVLKAKKRPFYCSIECADMFARTNHDPNGCDHIIAEIKLLAQSVRESKQETAHLRLAFQQSTQKIDTMVKVINEIEQSQTFLSKQFDSLHKDFDGFKVQLARVEKDNERIRAEVGGLNHNQVNTSSRLDQLEMEMDKMNRGMISNNAVVLGVPLLDDENPKEIVTKLGTVVGCALDGNAVTSARRLVGKNRTHQAAPILVSFCSVAVKEKLFEMKRSYGPLEASKLCDSFGASSNQVVIRDELTAFGRELYREVKELQSTMGFKYVWPGRNGKILIKRQDGARIEEINCMKEVENIKKQST